MSESVDAESQQLQTVDDDDVFDDDSELLSLPLSPSVQGEVPSLAPGEYHAFLSHSEDDKSIARHIVAQLEMLGFKCLLADRDFLSGRSVVGNMCECIQKSHKTIVLISPAFTRSIFFEFEVAEAVQQGINKKQCTYIPLLYKMKPSEVPSQVKSVTYVEHGTEGWMERLRAALVTQQPMSAMIPTGDVAYGLVWSYYFYLKIVIPGLEARIKKSSYAGDPDALLLPQYICILPVSCKCPHSMKDADENIETIGKVAYTVDMAGLKARDYSSQVHEVTHPITNKASENIHEQLVQIICVFCVFERSLKFRFLGEFVNALHTLRWMEEEKLSGMTPRQRVHQMELFQDKLQEILRHSKEIKFQILRYNDTQRRSSSHVESPQRLARLLADLIDRELRKNACIEHELKRSSISEHAIE